MLICLHSTTEYRRRTYTDYRTETCDKGLYTCACSASVISRLVPRTTPAAAGSIVPAAVSLA